MSGTEEDQPITEEEFARMLGEEDAARANGAQEVVEPEPEEEPEPEPELPEAPLGPEVTDPGEILEVPDEPLPPLTPETESVEIAEHLAWAERRNLMNFEDAAKLAWEQEKFLGRKASEIEELRQQLAEGGQAQQAAPTRSDNWMAQALSSPDPGRYAYELAQNGEWGTYEQYMQMWEQVVGESVTVNVHNQILATLEQQQPEQPA